MGYFTLDFKKAKGASDARMSDHIERRVIASNVDPHTNASQSGTCTTARRSNGT